VPKSIARREDWAVLGASLEGASVMEISPSESMLLSSSSEGCRVSSLLTSSSPEEESSESEKYFSSSKVFSAGSGCVRFGIAEGIVLYSCLSFEKDFLFQVIQKSYRWPHVGPRWIASCAGLLTLQPCLGPLYVPSLHFDNQQVQHYNLNLICHNFISKLNLDLDLDLELIYTQSNPSTRHLPLPLALLACLPCLLCLAQQFFFFREPEGLWPGL